MTSGISMPSKAAVLGLLFACAGCAASTLGELQTEYASLVRIQAEQSMPTDEESPATYPVRQDQAFADLADRANKEVSATRFSILGLGEPDIRTRIAFARTAALAAVSAGPVASTIGRNAQSAGIALCNNIPAGEFKPARDCALLQDFIPIALVHARYLRSIEELLLSFDVSAQDQGKVEIWCGGAPAASDGAQPEVVDTSKIETRNETLQRCTGNYLRDVVSAYLGPRSEEGVDKTTAKLNSLLGRNIDSASRRYYRGQGVRILCLLRQVSVRARRLNSLMAWGREITAARAVWAEKSELSIRISDLDNACRQL